MGLLGDWMKSKRMRDPVRGTLYVSASTLPPDSATSANFALNGIVSATGIAPTAIEHQGMAKTRKWPHAGQTLPVTVDRADPTRIRIEWDEVPDSWSTARTNAEQLAESMRQSPAGSGPVPPAGVFTVTSGLNPPGPTSMVFQQGSSTNIDASNVPGLREEIMKIVAGGMSDPAATQQLIHAKLVEAGVLNADGTPGPKATVTGHTVTPATGQPLDFQQPGGPEDPAARLRTLVQLHRDGLITDAEFARLRTQILGEL